jgi:predicted metal-dependent hydrolase
MLLPGVLADYIICHELAHLQFLNHSPDFWRLTEELCPNALDKRKRLRALPPLWPAE